MPPKYRNENFREELPPRGNNNGSPLVSDKLFSKVNAAVAIGGSIVVPVFYFFQREYIIEQGDIQTLAEVVTGAGSLALAVPIFFKDVDRGALFWKQFFLIAITFFVAAFVSMFCLLKLTDTVKGKSVSVEITLAMFILVSVSLVSHALPALRQISPRSNPNSSRFAIDVPVATFLAFLSIGICISLTPDNKLIAAFIILTFFGFYLTLLVCLSLALQMTVERSDAISINNTIKQAIELSVWENRDRALSKDQLLYILRNRFDAEGVRSVNSSIVHNLLNEMDDEAGSGPKISLTGSLIIPRWSNEITSIVLAAEPKMFVRSSYDSRMLNSFFSKESEKAISVLSQTTGLSNELLTDGNALQLKYTQVWNSDVLNEIGLHRVSIVFQDEAFTKVNGQVNLRTIFELSELDNYLSNHAVSLDRNLTPLQLTDKLVDLTGLVTGVIKEEDVLHIIKHLNKCTTKQISAALQKMHSPEISNYKLQEKLADVFNQIVVDYLNNLYCDMVIDHESDDDNFDPNLHHWFIA